jgi:hypothetical protein
MQAAVGDQVEQTAQRSAICQRRAVGQAPVAGRVPSPVAPVAARGPAQVVDLRPVCDPAAVRAPVAAV